MTKLSYGEQLKHPFWQRKRLEVLEFFAFKCATCGSGEKTLHVHHKQYIKGRSAWDYPLDNFEALCEDCHEDAHEAKARINEVLAQFPSSMWLMLFSLLVGYGSEDGYVDLALWEHVDSDPARAGNLAYALEDLHESGMLEVRDIFKQLGPDRFIEALRATVRKDFDA